MAALLGREFMAAQHPQHAEHAVHRRAYLVAHGGEELGFGSARLLGALACLGVTFHFMLEVIVGLGELLRAFLYEFFQFLPVAPEFRFRLVPRGLDFALADRLLLEELDGAGHLGQFVVSGNSNVDAQIAPGQLGHPAGQVLQSGNHVAAHIEPDNESRQRQRGQSHGKEREQPHAHGGFRLLRRGLGKGLGVFDQAGDQEAQLVGQPLVLIRKPLDLRRRPQDGAVKFENVAGVSLFIHRLQSGENRLALGPAHRVVYAGDAPLEDLQVLPQAVLQPQDFLEGVRFVELIE